MAEKKQLSVFFRWYLPMLTWPAHS